MRTQIAYALIALLALVVLFLFAKLRTRKESRPKKHLRIDLLGAERERGPQATVDGD